MTSHPSSGHPSDPHLSNREPTAPPVEPPAGPAVLYLGAGGFGAQVVKQLHRETPGTVHGIDGGTHPSLWPHADLVVLATASDRPQVAEAVDRAAFLRRIPWLPVTARATEIQVGPVVVPGRTPCHRCCERRRRQHGLVPPAQAALERDPGQPAEPAEFALLRHHVSLAAGLARQAFAEVRDASAETELHGTVRLFNLISGSVSSAPVLAVDGCDRCRGRFGAREETRQAMWDRLEAATGSRELSGAAR